jgi:hypothetical protein
MRANRQLYSETAQIVYERPTFHAALVLDEFQIFSRDFDVGHKFSNFNMLESQLRHINDLELYVYADEDFCPRLDMDGHSCKERGCARKRVDGIRNAADFLSCCVGLSSLVIKVIADDYRHATMRPVVAKEMRRIEKDLLTLIRPFGMIRNLAYCKIYILDLRKSNFSAPQICLLTCCSFPRLAQQRSEVQLRGRGNAKEHANGRITAGKNRLCFHQIYVSVHLFHEYAVRSGHETAI